MSKKIKRNTFKHKAINASFKRSIDNNLLPGSSSATINNDANIVSLNYSAVGDKSLSAPLIKDGPISTKIKLTYYGDSPTASTGFGTVARNILLPLHNSGEYDIKVLGINYWGDPHQFPFPIWPMAVGLGADMRDPFGRQKAQNLLMSKSMEYDILFMLQDTFIMNSFLPQFVPKLRNSGRRFRSVYYFPIDGIPKPTWMSSVDVVDVPVTYTNFGFKECVKILPTLKDKLRIISHGVNTTEFFPIEQDKVLEFRERFFKHKSKSFIMLNVNRNQQRKDIPRSLMVLKEIRKKIDDCILYLHCAIVDQGWNMEQVSYAFGFDLKDGDVIMPSSFNPAVGFPIQTLNFIYNASDLVISTTVGEGWGLSATEAMATNRCCVFPDNTSLNEIFADGRGKLVKCGDTPSHFNVIPNDNEIIRPVVNVEDMAEKIIYLYEHPEERAAIAKKGYDYTINNLTWSNHITPQWDRLFKEEYNKITKVSHNGNQVIGGSIL